MKEKFDIATFPAPDAEELDFIRQCLPETEGLDRFLERCTIYGKFLYTTNETMNLTRIPPSDFWSKHVCDAVSILRELPDLCGGGALCDLGCGAGIPSVILAALLMIMGIAGIFISAKPYYLRDYFRYLCRKKVIRILSAVYFILTGISALIVFILTFIK